MTVPGITSVDPSGGSSNVPINKVIKVVWDTGLDTGSINPSTFSLRHQNTKITVPVSVDYSTGTYTVTVIPNTLLYKNSTYRLRIVGSDINAPGGWVRGSDGTAFTGTTNYLWISGNDIQVAPGQKTDTEESFEGDVRLPSSLRITTDAPFQLIGTKPSNHSWGFTGNSITLTFNKDVNPNTGLVSKGIELTQRPFLDEDQWFARNGVYQWDTDSWSNQTGTYFTAPLWDISISGAIVTLSHTGAILNNSVYEINILDTLPDMESNTLENEYSIIFTSESTPNFITPRSIRNEVNAVFDSLNSDFVHQLVWKHTIDAFRLAGHNVKTLSGGQAPKGHYIRKYVKAATVLDIVTDMMLEKMIMAGTTKILGDFTISYHPNAGISKPLIIDRWEKELQRARRAIAYSASSARIFMKGWNSAMDRQSFRTRLWKNPENTYNYSRGVSSSTLPAANTAEERKDKLPGNYDLWS